MANQMTNDQKTLTSVGPGTAMGNLLRHYWIPALRSSEVNAGGSPVRLLLLGEKLIAFRSPDGQVGVMDHRCPHRNASLFYGRNEEGGIRCIYHGWKFDVAGICVDVPNTPDRFNVAGKVRAVVYPTFERQGVVWVFMGDPERVPAPPDLEALEVPDCDIEIEFLQRECNFLQAMEGDLDTSHLAFLHAGHMEPEHLRDDDFLQHVVRNRKPEIEVSDSDWGTTYCGRRDIESGGQYLRYANFLFPFWTQAPQGEFTTNVFVRAWVPMDDTHTMSVTFNWLRRPPAFLPMRNGESIPGLLTPMEFKPNTTDWYGRYATVQSSANDYMIDRTAQSSNANFSGIENVTIQDQAVTESMGPITDHSREHLAPSDLMIARTRRRLLRAAEALDRDGTLPPGVEDPSIYRGARSGELQVRGSDDVWHVYREQLAAATRVSSAK